MRKSVIFRSISAIVSIAVLLTSVFVVNAKYFSDVSKGDWSRDHINYASDNGYIEGTSSAKFSPDNYFTRGEAALMLYKLEGSPSVTVTSSFTDVSTTSKYAKAVSWAHKYGIMNGTDTSTFDPDKSIIRQDITVILYKYAVMKGYNTKASADITSFSDYSEVSGYAVNAMKWGVGIGLIASDQSALSPKSKVTREVAAAFLSKFSIRVEGIVSGRDNFSFDSRATFYRDSDSVSRYISSNDLANLIYYIKLFYTEKDGDVNTAINLIKNSSNRSGMPDFGMSACVYADKIGKADINGNYGTGSNKTMYSLTNPYYNKDLTSAITFYDLVQYLSGVKKNPQVFPNTRNIINELNKNGIALVVYTYENDSREYTCPSVAYGLKVNSDGSYTAQLYDPFINGEFGITLDISKDKSSAKAKYHGIYDGMDLDAIDAYDEITGLYYVNSSVFEKYDVDGAFNNMASASAASVSDYSMNSISADTADVETETGARLYVTLDGSFEITNAEGEKLIYKDCEFSGDMNIISQSYIARGRGEASGAIIYVNSSSEFTYTSDDGNGKSNEFYVLDDELYAGAEGDGISKIYVSAEGDVNVCGENLTYKMVTSPFTESVKMVTVIGCGSESVSMTSGNDNIILEGVSDDCKAYVFDGDMSQTINPVNSGSIKAVPIK